MNGPDHYLEAEDCLRLSDAAERGGDPVSSALFIHEAQVHATLALAASSVRHESRDIGQWRMVLQ